MSNGQQFNDFGCHKYNRISESIDKKVTNRIEDNLMDNNLCAKICSLYGHEYSATYKEYFCLCLKNDLKIDASLNSSKCNMPCENNNENCGGSIFFPNTFTVNFNQFKSKTKNRRSLEDDNQHGIDAIDQTTNELLRLSNFESTVEKSSSIIKLEEESISAKNINAKFGRKLLSIFQYSSDSNDFSNKNYEYGTSSEFSFSTPIGEIFENPAADKYPKIVGCVDRMQDEKFQKEKYFKDLTNEECSVYCKSENFNYSETNIGNTKSNCYCVDNKNIKNEISNECNLECKVGSGEMCGGDPFETVSLTQIIKYDENNTSDLYKTSISWFECLKDYSYFAILENVKDQDECAIFCEFLNSTNFALKNINRSKNCFCGKQEIQNLFFVQIIPICSLSQYSVFTIEPFWLSFECGGNLTTAQWFKCNVKVTTKNENELVAIFLDEKTNITKNAKHGDIIDFYWRYPLPDKYKMRASMSSLKNDILKEFEIKPELRVIFECKSNITNDNETQTDSMLTKAKTGEVLICNLTAYTYYIDVDILIDYDDGQSNILKLNETTLILKKKYSLPATYSIISKIIGQNGTNSKFTLEITGNPDCSDPILFIPNSGTLKNPTKFSRTSLITIVGNTYFECGLKFTDSRYWIIELYENEEPKENITLENNRTMGKAELVLAPRSLNYGVYKLTYTVKINYRFRNISIDRFTSIETFIKIIPSDLIVKALNRDQIQIVLTGSSDLILDPGSFSIDPDNFISPKSLYFNFTCKKIPTEQFTTDKYIKGTNVVKIFSNKLIIPQALLKYEKDMKYLFLIETEHMGKIFNQEISVIRGPSDLIPSVQLMCRTPSPKYQSFILINPNTNLILDSSCMTGCDSASKIDYEYKIYFIDSNIWTLLPNSHSYFKSQNSKELIISNELFSNYSHIKHWRINFALWIDDKISQRGETFLQFKINELPSIGECLVEPANGISSQQQFLISCSNWHDNDGYIVNYEFYADFKNNPLPIALNYNVSGKIYIKLPVGPASDDYKITISVRIIDDTGGYVIYKLKNPVRVFPGEDQKIDQMVDLILDESPKLTFFTELKSGNLQKCAENVISFTSNLNSIPNKNKTIIFDNTTNTTQTEYERQINLKAESRLKLINTLNNISRADLSSIKIFSSMISLLTKNHEENSRNISETAILTANELIDNLDGNLTNSGKYEDIYQISGGLFDTVANSLISFSKPLYMDQDYLNMDSLGMNSLNTSNSSFVLFYNNTKEELDQIQKQKLIETNKKATEKLEVLTKKLSSYLGNGEESKIRTDSISLDIKKNNASDFKEEFNIDQTAKIQIPSICDMLSQALNFSQSSECNQHTLIQKTVVLPLAITGQNGNNDIYVGNSKSISLNFYNDKNEPIKIENQKNPIKFWIPRDSNKIKHNETFINIDLFNQDDLNNNNLTSNETNQFNQTLPKSIFMLNKFNLTSTSNTSIHIQIKPSSFNVGYLVILKFNDNPHVKSNSKLYDSWKLFCPSDLKNASNDSLGYFMFFMNMSQLSHFKLQANSFGVFGIRELDYIELEDYCANETNKYPYDYPPHYENSNITGYMLFNNFSFFVFTSGCYYLDVESGYWLTDGLEVLEDTNLEFTLCQTSHLTQFAGGFIVLPTKINFENVFANSSFDKNPTIYITLIVMGCVYIISAILCRFFDHRDKRKKGVVFLTDDLNSENLYEIIVFTGNRKNSATNSKVSIKLHGTITNSNTIKLFDSKRKVFRRSGIDKFIISTEKDLGLLTFIKIWHDNSGRRNSSWFLKFVVINQVKTNEKYYFIHENWLALDKGDYNIEKIIPAASQRDKNKFKYLVSKQTKINLSDNHLWFSVFARPVQSSFTRLDRLTCCFVLLNMTMLTNILYYDVDKTASNNGLKIGPLSLTPEQIGIGIISNLIVFPPSFLIMQLFRRSKSRHDENKNQKDKIKKKGISFPWWVKIIAYFLSIIVVGVSVFFIIVKSVSFGDEKVQKWLTSLVVSVLASVLLTQPIQVALVAFFFVVIFKSSDDKKTEMVSYGKNKSKNYSKSDIVSNESDSKNPSLKEQDHDIIRQKKIKEKKILRIFMNIIFQALFLSILYIVAYSNRDYNSF
ncbi:unnamed protein product, partial [Brachionus calyciflorus]